MLLVNVKDYKIFLIRICIVKLKKNLREIISKLFVIIIMGNNILVKLELGLILTLN